MAASPVSCEVLIVGAGPAGASLAVWLSQDGWDCVLVDRARFPRRKPCAGCFAPKCFPSLRRLGLEEVVKTGRQIRCLELRMPGCSVRLHTGRNRLGGDFYVFPRERFDALLVETARNRGARVMEGVEVESLDRKGERVVGATARDRSFRSEVTVIAVGASLRFLPPEQKKRVRRYQALIGWFEECPRLDPFTADAFCAPWLPGNAWIFPESDGRANVGIMVPAEKLKGAGGKLHSLFEAYCADPGTAVRLSGARRPERLWGSPIQFAARPVGICGDGFLAIGEASLLTHPMTGEGISQALRSAEAAAATLARARAAGSYGAEALGDYDRKVQAIWGRNFRKATLLRHVLDSPALLRRLIGLAGRTGWLAGLVEAHLDRFAL